MTVKRRRDEKTPKVLMHKIADIRGGVSVKVSELGGDYLAEGALLSAAEEGICHVVKTAVIAEGCEAAATVVKVKKHHNLRVGDVVMAGEGGAAVEITGIDGSAKGYDSLTLKTALGKLDEGAVIAEAAAESTAAEKKSALKYEPQSVNGTGKPFEAKGNLDTDAWVIGVTKGLALPEWLGKHLKGIVAV